MDKLIPILFLLLPLSLFAQVPQGLNYQAVAWDKNNSPKANRTIYPIIYIRELRMDGPVVYMEKPVAMTNVQGYFTLTIGKENPTEFQKINWANGPKYLQVIIDDVPTTTQILSVPYALYAEDVNLKAGTGIQIKDHVISNTGDGDKDDENELQNLKLTGYKLELDKGGGSVNLPKVGINRHVAKFETYYLKNGSNKLNDLKILIPESGKYMVFIKVSALSNVSNGTFIPSTSLNIGTAVISNFSFGEIRNLSEFGVADLTAGEFIPSVYCSNIDDSSSIYGISITIMKL